MNYNAADGAFVLALHHSLNPSHRLHKTNCRWIKNRQIYLLIGLVSSLFLENILFSHVFQMLQRGFGILANKELGKISMTFKSFRFAEVMLSSEGKEQMKGAQMWDKEKKGGEKERGGADQKGNRERGRRSSRGAACVEEKMMVKGRYW